MIIVLCVGLMVFTVLVSLKCFGEPRESELEKLLKAEEESLQRQENFLKTLEDSCGPDEYIVLDTRLGVRSAYYRIVNKKENLK